MPAPITLDLPIADVHVTLRFHGQVLGLRRIAAHHGDD